MIKDQWLSLDLEKRKNKTVILPAYLYSTCVHDFNSSWVLYWVALLGFCATNIFGCSPECICKVPISSPRQAYFSFYKSIKNFIRRVQLAPRSAALIACQVLSINVALVKRCQVRKNLEVINQKTNCIELTGSCWGVPVVQVSNSLIAYSIELSFRPRDSYQTSERLLGLRLLERSFVHSYLETTSTAHILCCTLHASPFFACCGPPGITNRVQTSKIQSDLHQWHAEPCFQNSCR